MLKLQELIAHTIITPSENDTLHIVMKDTGSFKTTDELSWEKTMPFFTGASKLSS